MVTRIFKLVILSALFWAPVFAEEAADVRLPFVSGSFYPSDPAALSSLIQGFLDRVPSAASQTNGKLIGVVVPHAGYIYSGQTAAYSYALLKNSDFDTALILGPSHRTRFEGASIWTKGFWETPLGKIPIDEELAGLLYNENSVFQFARQAHANEHSIETQLAFLQKIKPGVKIVPIAMNGASSRDRDLLAEAIVKHTRGKKVVLITSTDLSHYHPESAAHRMDGKTLDLMKALDRDALGEALNERNSELCGHTAVLVFLKVAQLLGNTDLKVLHYTTSADGSGDSTNVVGYASAALWKKEEVLLDQAQRAQLLSLARRTVEAVAQHKELPAAESDDPVLGQKGAVFVTIQNKHVLRGCIGRILPEEPLILAVRHMAMESATKDPRFAPVSSQELADLSYEISVLSPPRDVASADAIEMGKHGVILSQGGHSGVFLPKVAESFNWDKEAFLSELCSQKAGLDKGCWQDPRTRIQVFTAQEFS